MDALDSLRRSIPLLVGHVDAVTQELVAEQGLTRSQTLCLFELRTGPLTSGELARRLGLTSGAVSHLLRHLEAAGAVTRHVDPDDRRRVLVSADPGVVEMVDSRYATLDAALVRSTASLSVRDVTMVAKFLERLDVECRRTARDQP